MSSIVVRLKYKFYGMFLFSILFLFGCGSHPKKSTIREKVTGPESQVSTESSPQSRMEEAIKQAEAHYEKGIQYHRQQHWGLASREFDLSLKTLLDADVDAETHYKLGRIYSEYSEKIHKFREQQPNSQLARVQESKTSPGTGETTGTNPPPSPQAPSPNSTQPPVGNPNMEKTASLNEGTPIIFNSPVEIDEKIQEWIYLYTRKKDSKFLRGLERSTKYLPMIKKIFTAEDLPLDLAYVPLIESHFSTDAVSPSGAVGMWQFVRSTARNYGLRVDKWVDERKDPEKSTRAAAKYLKDLYRMLGSWDLVIAAYNSGEYKIHNAIGRYRTRDFEELSSTGYLSEETQNYVPMLKAAIIVANNPGKYGLNPTYESPLVYNDETAPRKNPPVKTFVAKGYESYQSLRELNLRSVQRPAQQGGYGPFGPGTSRLKNPSDRQILATVQFPNEKESTSHKDQAFTAISQPNIDEFGYDRSGTSSGRKREFTVYRIQKGDDLYKVASRFNVSILQLILWNKLNTATLSPDDELKIWIEKSVRGPVTQAPTDQKGLQASRTTKPSKEYSRVKRITSTRTQLPKRKKIIYSVKKGDNLWQLSQNFNVDLQLLRKWNRLSPKERLMPGDKLVIHLNQSVN